VDKLLFIGGPEHRNILAIAGTNPLVVNKAADYLKLILNCTQMFGIGINDVDTDGNSALALLSAANGVKPLLEAGIDVTLRNSRKENALESVFRRAEALLALNLHAAAQDLFLVLVELVKTKLVEITPIEKLTHVVKILFQYSNVDHEDAKDKMKGVGDKLMKTLDETKRNKLCAAALAGAWENADPSFGIEMKRFFRASYCSIS